jgi:hypothetical protein
MAREKRKLFFIRSQKSPAEVASMVSSLYKLIAACRRSKAFAAFLVPAFLFGTLPRSACICADGHKELNCDATACFAIAHGKEPDRCSEACCQPSDGGKRPTCCQTKLRSDNTGRQPASGLAPQSGCCCNPIVETQAPATTSKNIKLHAHKHLLTTMLPVSQLISALPAAATIRALANLHGPPPLDAVIVYLHLTI